MVQLCPKVVKDWEERESGMKVHIFLVVWIQSETLLEILWSVLVTRPYLEARKMGKAT